MYTFLKAVNHKLQNLFENKKLISGCMVSSSLNKLKSRIYEIVVLHISSAVNWENDIKHNHRNIKLKWDP